MENPDDVYVKNDRSEFVKGEKSEALLKWIQESVNTLSKKMEEKQRKERRAKDLDTTSNFNQILSTWNHQFLRTMLKEQPFGEENEPGVGGPGSNAPVIGSNEGKRPGQKGSKTIGSKGGKESRKAPKHSTILISSQDPDPLSGTGETYDCDPRQPTIHQRPMDVQHGIYWINTSKPLADLILKRNGSDSPHWRYYLFQRHVDVIIKESIYQLGKKEVSISADDVSQKIDEMISRSNDKASEDLIDFLFKEDYKL
jgi:hypothetical protein